MRHLLSTATFLAMACSARHTLVLCEAVTFLALCPETSMLDESLNRLDDRYRLLEFLSLKS